MMSKLCFLFTIALLCHAHGFRIKRQGSNSTPNCRSMSDYIILQDCLQSCPVTPEFNPVCGSDNVTYANPGRLQCAQSCGINVTKVRSSPCPTESTTPPA